MAIPATPKGSFAVAEQSQRWIRYIWRDVTELRKCSRSDLCIIYCLRLALMRLHFRAVVDRNRNSLTPTFQHHVTRLHLSMMMKSAIFTWSGFLLVFGLVTGMYGLQPKRSLDPIPQNLAPFQLSGDVSKRQSQSRPLNIDLSVYRRGDTELQWYGEITVGTPPQKL
jgi:hypothetical protein